MRLQVLIILAKVHCWDDPPDFCCEQPGREYKMRLNFGVYLVFKLFDNAGKDNLKGFYLNEVCLRND